VLINIEHTLVLPGGRGSGGSPEAFTSYDGKTYLVRLPRDEQTAKRASLIVDFSRPNIHHVKNSELSELYEKKAIYIAPIFGNKSPELSPSGRDLSNVYTLMNLAGEADRRNQILFDFEARTSVRIVNISGLHSHADSRLGKVGVMLNLHQTDHHQTLEELRILPMLLRGIITISEPSPLLSQVPYARFIRFARPEHMAAEFYRIKHNYFEEWKGIFADPEYERIIADLRASNESAFTRMDVR
jgi:hypothetical protein